MSPWRVGAILALCALLLWLSTGVTLTLRKSSPAAALNVWPWGAEPKAALAEKALEQAPDGSRRAVMAVLAQAALAREPVNVQAARTLAFARGFTDPAAATRAFTYAERLSRRDLPTEFWLIESAVQRGDIREALVHYDRALRTSRRSGDILLPTLVSAADTPPVAAAIVPFIRARPSWWRPFMLLAIEKSGNPVTLAQIVAGFRPDLKRPEEHEVARLAIARLADLKQFALAANLYARLGAGRPDVLLRDGDFDTGGDLAPLDWSLRDDTELGAAPDRPAGGDARLEMHATDNAEGEIARQLLVLPPGSFVLSGTAGGGEGSAQAVVRLTLQCVEGATLARRELALAANNSGFKLPFVVAPTCKAQWLLIGFGGAATGWIDKLAIRPVAGLPAVGK